MQCRALLALVTVASSPTCVSQNKPAHPVPLAVMDGRVVSFETGEPIPHVEVCVFGSDTTCVRSDTAGRYRARVTPGTVTVRFRTPGLPLGLVRNVEVTPTTPASVSCAMTGRIGLSEETSCLPVRAQ